MNYRQLGRTGLYVSELCFGAMTFGGEGFWKVVGTQGQAEADRLVGRSLDAGINFFDTANVYSNGASEQLLGKALGAKRSNVILATKVRGRMGPGVNDVGLSRGHIMDSVHASLKRLGTDYIDLYQIHGYDAVTPLDETLRAFDDLVRQGKVRYLGASNLAAWQLMKALGISEHKGLSRFESLQAYYTIAGRDLERELVPLMKDQQLGLMVWSPLAGGFLSGKHRRDAKGPEGTRRAEFDFPPVNKERAYDVIDVMDGVAKEHGVSVARVALAWLLHQPHVTTIIIGAKTEQQLEDNLFCTTLKLSPEQLAKLDAVSKLPPEYPGWMVERQAEGRVPPTK
ncbi:aldo/keto reductase [Pyxidicoccus sp. 3LG]